MPQSVGLICPKKFKLEAALHSISMELGLREYVGDEYSSSTQLQDEHLGVYADFILMSDQVCARDEYLANDSLDLSFRGDNLAEKSFYMVTYNDLNFVRRILEKLLPFAERCDGRFWVDDDSGNIFGLDEFI